MATFKKLSVFVVVGALLGGVVASLIAPGMIAWYSSPGYAVPQGFDFSAMTHQVMSALLRSQAIGAGVGALAMLVVGTLVGRRKKVDGAASDLQAQQTAAPPLPKS